ncbi:hypothetical protein [Pelomicrobium sp.]|uniref:hypothetical protein n=1 Tax=Pelomicrobium sp. TaxID=2815319 RepID=UPI002FDE308B
MRTPRTVLTLAAALAALAAGAVSAETKTPRQAQALGRYELMLIKDAEGRDTLVRMDKESGATWVMRYGEYPPSPKGPIHYWMSVPCVRGDSLTRC